MILLPVVEENSDEDGAMTQASPFRNHNAIESNAKAITNIRFTMVSQQFEVLFVVEWVNRPRPPFLHHCITSPC